jgi:RHS repeat-associated protein
MADPGDSSNSIRLWTSAGDLKKQTDGMGNSIEYVYDDSARTVTISQKDWNTTTSSTPNTYVEIMTVDKSGRTIKETDKGKSTGSGREVEITYDKGGRITLVTRPSGAEVSYEYDVLGRLTKEEADIATGTAATSEWSWTDGGRMQSRKDGNGNETWYSYNSFDQEIEIKYTVDLAATLDVDKYDVVTKSYNSNGLLESVTDPEGSVLNYGYDDGGRLITADFVVTGTDLVGPDRIQFKYDEMDRITEGKTQELVSGSYSNLTVVTRSFDGFGRMAEETQAGGYVIKYDSYDDSGHLAKLVLPIGGPVSEIEYLYNDGGSVETIKRKLNGGIMATAASIDYEGSREIKRVQAPFDLTREQSWTDYREPEILTISKTSTGSLLTGLHHRWDDDGNLTLRERMHDKIGTDLYGEVYRYDGLNRLTSYWTNVENVDIYHASDPTADYDDKVTLTLGDVYERTKKTVATLGGSTVTSNYSLNDAHQITAIGATSRQWDDNGQLTDDGTWAYTWTALGQIALAEHSSLDDREFTYDAFGRRVSTKVGTSSPVEHIYHGWHLVGEHDGTRWLWMEVPMPVGEGMLEHHGWDGLAHKELAVHEDFQKTVWGLSDTTAALFERYQYENPFGSSHTLDSSATDIGDFASEVFHRKRLHGGVVDEKLGLYDFRNRWLDPVTGSWLSRDPMEYGDTNNLYQFALHSPLRKTDVYGLLVFCNGAPMFEGHDVMCGGDASAWMPSQQHPKLGSCISNYCKGAAKCMNYGLGRMGSKEGRSWGRARDKGYMQDLADFGEKAAKKFAAKGVGKALGNKWSKRLVSQAMNGAGNAAEEAKRMRESAVKNEDLDVWRVNGQNSYCDCLRDSLKSAIKDCGVTKHRSRMQVFADLYDALNEDKPAGLIAVPGNYSQNESKIEGRGH